MNAIETSQLSKSFRNIYAVLDLSMNVPEGSIYGFIGENGSGKSTTEKLLTGLLVPNSGEMRLFGNVLNLNRLENQEILPVTEAYDLCGQLSDIAMALDKSLNEKNINLEVEMDDRLMIRYDPGMIELVWHNLLSNAVKFTPSDGTVSLKQTSDNGFVIVSVSDTGPGMDDETIKHIFDKFYQSDTSHSGEGNGLGFALVRRILELVDGNISVSSKPHEGTTFTVKFAVK